MEIKLVCSIRDSEEILNNLSENGVDDIADALDIVGSLTRHYQEKIFHGFFRYDGVDHRYRLVMGKYQSDERMIVKFYRSNIPYGRFAVLVIGDPDWCVYSNMDDAEDKGYIPATDLPKYITNNISEETFDKLMKTIGNASSERNFKRIVEEISEIKTHPDIVLTTDVRARLEHEISFLAGNWQFDEIAHVMDLVEDLGDILNPDYKN